MIPVAALQSRAMYRGNERVCWPQGTLLLRRWIHRPKDVSTLSRFALLFLFVLPACTPRTKSASTQHDQNLNTFDIHCGFLDVCRSEAPPPLSARLRYPLRRLGVFDSSGSRNWHNTGGGPSTRAELVVRSA
ncbi:MAG: hypothetical protein B6A08_13920 [Sorangiineae bacterium NIC37A_2]|nr:MAG: hypothetical protein B6A08_13920 [Sorangiineae bacterium NIC37A_2]